MICQAMVEDFNARGKLGHRDEAGNLRYTVADLEFGVEYAERELDEGRLLPKTPPVWSFAKFIPWAEHKIALLRAEEVALHSQYPEHEKMDRARDESRNFAKFLEWLDDEHGIRLARVHSHTGGCYDESDRLDCGLHVGEMVRVEETVERLLASYFGVDQRRFAEEERAILAEVRSTDEPAKRR